MKLQKFARELMLASALVGSFSVPTTAIAQVTDVTATSGDACSSFANVQSRAERFFGVCSVVRGVSFTGAQWQQLRTHGILIIASFNQQRIDERAARYGWRSDNVRDAIDDVSKEGSTIVVWELSGDGLRSVTKYNGIDVSQNGHRVTTYSLADDSDGTPIMDQIVWNENWQSILSKTAATAMGNLVTGAGVTLIDRAVPRPRCNGSRCDRSGGGNVITIGIQNEGSEANAGAQAIVEQTNTGTPPNNCHGQNGPTC